MLRTMVKGLCFVNCLLLTEVLYGAGAYTHIFVADRALALLEAAEVKNGKVWLELPQLSERPKAYPVQVPVGLVQLLRKHEASFRAGAIGPDFFPDVFVGITVSHQPCLKGASLKDFMGALADSDQEATDAQLAYQFGYLCHLCTDVFAHHWVGMESNGDFESWIDTQPEVVRLHLGLEKLWDEELQKRLPKRANSFTVDTHYIRRITLTKGAALCDRYYDVEKYANLYALIQLVRLGEWHDRRQQEAVKLRDSIGDKMILAKLNRVCPMCKGKRLVEETVKTKCPVCSALGEIDTKDHKNCPVCRGAGVVASKCPTCHATGKITDKIKGCPLCRGDGKVDCKACGGSGSLRRKTPIGRVSAPCPTCLGKGRVKCPCNVGKVVLETVKKTCPNCKGERTLREVCKKCDGNKKIEVIVRSTCPKCQGQKLLSDLLSKPCPACVTSPVLVAKAVCGRVAGYHERRKMKALETVDSYIESHERLASCILDARYGEATESFDEFFKALDDFQRTEASFDDLVAPELRDVDERTRELAEKAVSELEELVPEWFIEIKRQIFSEVLSAVGKWTGASLTDAEKVRFKGIWDRFGSHERFPPLVNGVNLFLLAIEGCDLDKKGLRRAAEVLGCANNIDSRCQPYIVAPFKDNKFREKELGGKRFPWEQCFLPPLDVEGSERHCKECGISTTRRGDR